MHYIKGVARRLRRPLLVAAGLLAAASLHAQSPALLDTIARNNPTLRAALAGRRAAEAANRAETRLPDPEAEVAYLAGSPSGVPNRTNVSLTQELDWGVLTGRRKGLVEAADRTAAARQRGVYREVMADALEQLVLLVHGNRMVAEMEARLALAQQVEGLCLKLYDKGDLTEPEMNKARLNTVVAKADRQRAADERAAVMARLRALNGGLSFVCNDTVYSLPADDLCRAAETRSLPRTAAVEGAEAAVAEAEAEVKLARAQQWPSFTVGFQGEYIRQNNYSGLSLGLSLPLWGNKRAEVRRREAELLASRLDLADTQLTAGAQQELLAQKTRRLLQVADELHQGLLATSNSRLLQRSLELGQISLLDFLLETSFYYAARTAWLEAERDAYLSAAAIRSLEF
ncbi:MAG: TolC family protein [Bacteroidales bacterium]|nr:TolC family protein [Bacteroidales bacterium]MDD6731775.1 TolC family protein [Bacteroidales bacterium]